MILNKSDEQQEVIRFDAIVYKVQTLVDGGLRVTLDLPETAVMQVAELMECKRFEVPLIIIAHRNKQNLTELDDETKKEPKGKGTRVGRRRTTNRRDKLTRG